MRVLIVIVLLTREKVQPIRIAIANGHRGPPPFWTWFIENPRVASPNE